MKNLKIPEKTSNKSLQMFANCSRKFVNSARELRTLCYLYTICRVLYYAIVPLAAGGPYMLSARAGGQGILELENCRANLELSIPTIGLI